MVGFILGILFIIAGVVTFFWMRSYEETTYGLREQDTEVTYPLKKFSPLSWIACAFGALFIFLGCVTTVGTGNTGVVTVFGQVQDKTFDAGFHLKAPWESVVKMDNRVQKSQIELACFSADIQEVSCVYTINYQINKANAQNLYKTVGVNYYETAITPVVAESVKTVMAHYTAEELIGSRDKLASEVETILEQQLSKYNIEVVSTAIEDLDFTDVFTNAVEAKQVAAQNKLKAEIEQAQAVKQAEADAEVSKTKAQAEADVAKIHAQADLEVTKIQADAAEYAGQKEAAKNKAISEQLTKELLDYYQIQQWDGKYPDTYVGSDNVSAIINGSEK